MKAAVVTEGYDKDTPVALTEIGSAYERLKSHEAMKYLIRM